MSTKIAVLMTCFNRVSATLKCINSLVEGSKDIDFRFVITDDNSSDGTKEELLKLPLKIKVLEGDGKLFWNGGMRKSIAYALKSTEKFDYAFFVNDDVVFNAGAVNKLLNKLESSDAGAIVGATCDSKGEITYGGVRKTSKHFAKFELIKPESGSDTCDTFNCNALLLKAETFASAGNFDEKYIHSMGDYDYGFTLGKLGIKVLVSDEYVGSCEDNDNKGTWRDASLKRRERLKLKEGPKGLPRKDWFHFIKKNYGLLPAIYHTITPYIRILIKR